MSHSKRNAVSGRSRAAFTTLTIGLSATLVTLGGDSRWAWGQAATATPAANIENDEAQLTRLLSRWNNEAPRVTRQTATPPNSCNNYYRVETAVPMFGAPTTTNTNASGDHCSSPEALIRYACHSENNNTRARIVSGFEERKNAWYSAVNEQAPQNNPDAAYFHNRSVARIRRLLGQPTNGRNAPRTQPIAGITPLGHLRQQFLDLQASMTQHVEQLRRSTAPADRGQERDHNATFARLKQMIRELQFPNDRDYADQAARHCIGAQANVAFIRRFENGRVRQTVVPCPGVLLMGNAPAALGFMAMAMGKTIDTCALDGTFLNPRPRNGTVQQPLSMRPLLQSLRTCTARRFLPGGQNPAQQTHVLPQIDTVPFGNTRGTTTDPSRVLANPNPQRPHCGPCLSADLATGTTAQGNYDHSNEALGVFLATKALEGTRWEPGRAWPGSPYIRRSPTDHNDPMTVENSRIGALQFLCTDRPQNSAAHRMAALDRARIVLSSSRVFRTRILFCSPSSESTPRYIATASLANRRGTNTSNYRLADAEALPRGCYLDQQDRRLVIDPSIPSALGNAGGRATPTPTAAPAAPVTPPIPAAQPVVAPTPPANPAAPTPEVPTTTPEPPPAPPAPETPAAGGDGATGLTTFATANEGQLTARREAIEAAIRAQNPVCQALASRFTPANEVFTQRCGTTQNGRFDLDLRTENPQAFPASVAQGQYTVEIGCQMRCMCGDRHCWSPEATYRGQSQPQLATQNRFPTAEPALAAAINNDRTYYEFQQPENGRFSLVAKACLRGVAGPETLSQTACRSTTDPNPQTQGNQTFYTAGEPRTISLLGETSGQILDYNCTVRCACSNNSAGARTAPNPPQCLAFYTRGATRAIDDASRQLTHNTENNSIVAYTVTTNANSNQLTVGRRNLGDSAGELANTVLLLRMPTHTFVVESPETDTPEATQTPAPSPPPSTAPANPITLIDFRVPNPLVTLTLRSPSDAQCNGYKNRIIEGVMGLISHAVADNNNVPRWFTPEQRTTWTNLTQGLELNNETTPDAIICKGNRLQADALATVLGRPINPIQTMALNNNLPQTYNCNLNCANINGYYGLRATIDSNNPISAETSRADTNHDNFIRMLQHDCAVQGHEIFVASRRIRPLRPFSCAAFSQIPTAQRSFRLAFQDNANSILPTEFRNKIITCRLRPISNTDPTPRCLQIDEQTPEPEFEIDISEPRTTQTTGAAAQVTPAAVTTAATPATPAPNPSVTAPPSPAPVAAASPAPIAITLPDIAVPTASFQPLPYNAPSVTIPLPTPAQAQATCDNFRERMVNEVDALLDYYRNNNNSLPSWVGESRQAAWRNLVSSRPITQQTTALDLMCSGRNNQLNAEPLSRLLNRAVQHIPFLTRGSSANAVIENRMCQQTCTTGGTAPNQTLVLNTSAMSDLNRLPALNPLTNLAAQQHFLQHLCQQTAFDRWVPATERTTMTCEQLAQRMRSGSGSDQHNASPIFQMTLPDNVIERALPLHSTASAPVENVHVYCHLKTSSVDAVREAAAPPHQTAYPAVRHQAPPIATAHAHPAPFNQSFTLVFEPNRLLALAQDSLA